MNRLLLSAVFLIWIAGCAGPGPEVKPGPASTAETPEEKTVLVEAEGETINLPDNIVATKEQALMAAQRAALEKALGVYITGQTIVKQAAVLDQNIFSRTTGYIKKYDILSEKVDGELFRTKISAQVRLGDVKKDLDALGLLIKTQKVGNPRVMVIIPETIDGQPNSQAVVETALIKKLLDNSYRVIDQAQTETIKAQDQLKAIESPAEAAKLARQFDAEVVVAGKASSAFNTDKDLAGMTSYKARVEAKVVKTSTAEVILAEDCNSAGVDITKEMAAAAALGKAANVVADKLCPNIAVKLFEAASIQIQISGLASINDLNAFKDALKHVEGIIDIYTRSFDAGTAVMDVDLRTGNANTVSSRLEAMTDWKIKINELSGSKIKAQITR